MKQTKLWAAVAAILLLTAFFFFFPASYLKADTQQDDLMIREITLPKEEEKTDLTDEALFSLLSSVNQGNSIVYDLRDLKSREAYLKTIRQKIMELFSSFPVFRDTFLDETELFEQLAEQYRPVIRRFGIVTVSQNGSIEIVSLIVYRCDEFEICFEETLGMPVYYRMEEPLAHTFLNAQGSEMDSVRNYYYAANLPTLIYYDRFYDVSFENGDYTVILGDYDFYDRTALLGMQYSWNYEEDIAEYE